MPRFIPVLARLGNQSRSDGWWRQSHVSYMETQKPSLTELCCGFEPHTQLSVSLQFDSKSPKMPLLVFITWNIHICVIHWLYTRALENIFRPPNSIFLLSGRHALLISASELLSHFYSDIRTWFYQDMYISYCNNTLISSRMHMDPQQCTGL